MSFSFGPAPAFATSAPSTPPPTGFSFGSIRPAAATSAFSFGVSTPQQTPPTTPEPARATSTKPTTKTKATTPTVVQRATPRAVRVPSLSDGVEGVVTFPSRADASFRFEVVAKDLKLHFWLEDRKTKKQWRTAQLGLSDFVEEEHEIPQATFDDYAKCFLKCLEAEAASETDFSRDLVPAKDDANAWELQLTLKIRVFTTTWTPTYKFVLKSVPLEPVDVLAAKVRDQEEQISSLTRTVESLTSQLQDQGRRGTRDPLIVRGTLSSSMQTPALAGKLVWKIDNLYQLEEIVVLPSGGIRFNVGGTFVVSVMVENTNTNNKVTTELHVNGQSVVSCVDSNANGHRHVTPMYHVLSVVPNDEIVVFYRGTNHVQAGSYFVIHELR